MVGNEGERRGHTGCCEPLDHLGQNVIRVEDGVVVRVPNLCAQSAIGDPVVALRVQGWLEDEGYCNAVLVDETHAYLATGLPEKLKKDEECKAARGPFQRLFRKQKKALEVEGFCHYV